MNIAFHIPAWMLWVVGVPLAVVVLVCAYVGFVFLRDFRLRF